MKSITQLENKKVLVLGLAKSGEAAARLLAKLGAIVTVNDGKAFEENPSGSIPFLKKALRLFVVDILLNFWMKILN